jgi:hypothetical protein
VGTLFHVQWQMLVVAPLLRFFHELKRGQLLLPGLVNMDEIRSWHFLSICNTPTCRVSSTGLRSTSVMRVRFMFTSLFSQIFPVCSSKPVSNEVAPRWDILNLPCHYDARVL